MKLSVIRRWVSPRQSIQGKIFIAFSAVTLLSIASITIIVYMSMRETIMQNAVTSVSDSIRQADESLNMMLEEIDRLNTVVVTNKNTVIDTLRSLNEEISYEWFQEQKRMDEFLSSLIDYKAYISRIAVVGLSGKVYFSGGPWIDRTVLGTPLMNYMLQYGSRHAYYKQPGESGPITVGREIRYNREIIGMVMVDMDAEFISKTYGIKPTSDSMIYVLDQAGNFVYEPRTSPSFAPTHQELYHITRELASQDEAVSYSIKGKEFIVVHRKSDYTGWTTISLIPMDSLLTESNKLRKLLIEASLIVFVIVLIASLQVSSRITLNIRRLKNMMAYVKEGNLALPKKAIRSQDEMGQLYTAFMGMVEELKRSLERMRLSEKEKREAELTALQAQIQPHFLYNSLNTIKYLAKLNGVPNIENLSGSLIELMRGVLGNSSEFLTLREELDYIEHYVSIMKYRYTQPIRLVIEVEYPALLECGVLKLMLQPLVENAIIHGIGPLEREGIIIIRIFAEGGELVVSVIDNGKGILEEQRSRPLGGSESNGTTSRFSGIGVRNVHERITRVYGEAYGVSVYSEPGLYTKAEIRLPRMEKYKDDAVK